MSAELVPVPFHGGQILVLGEHVVVKPLCVALGLDVQAQQRRIERSAWGRQGTAMMAVPSAGGVQQTFCLHRKRLAMWLATLEVSRVREEARPYLALLQNEAADVLDSYFTGKAAKAAPALDEEAVRAMVRREVAELERAAAARHSQLGDGLRRAFTGQGTQLQVIADQIDGRADEVLGALAAANEMNEARARDQLERLNELPDVEFVTEFLRESQRAQLAELLAALGQALTQAAGVAPRAAARSPAPEEIAMWVTPRRAAEILGIPANTLLQRIYRGDAALGACSAGEGKARRFHVPRILAYQQARARGER